MVSARTEGIILEKTDLAFERQGVLNPAFIEVDGVGHMFYRAVGENGVSSIGYCRLEENRVAERLDRPLLVPEYDFERMGIEDPRIVHLEGLYYLFYTAFDGQNALVAYATSPDLVKFDKQGVISPRMTYRAVKPFFNGLSQQKKYHAFELRYRRSRGADVLLWEKNSFVFPQKIKGRYALIHRVLPGIQLIYFNDFTDLTETYWQDYFAGFGKSILLEPAYHFETWLGGGCPPIETEAGWLFIYHAVKQGRTGNIYRASAALLDRDDPQRVLGRLTRPLFSPQEPWEQNGTVNNVVFPTGATIRNGKLYVYYGAADQLIGARSFDVDEVLHELQLGPDVPYPRVAA